MVGQVFLDIFSRIAGIARFYVSILGEFGFLFGLRRVIFHLSYKFILWLPQKCFHPRRSDVPIDVLIPAIERDLPVLPFVIGSVRRQVKHPLGRILIVAPESELIRRFCTLHDVLYVFEDSMAAFTRADVARISGAGARVGWIYQQLLKLSPEKSIAHENYLVLDADTVFISPQVFVNGGKAVYRCSDELFMPYRETIRRLLGWKARYPLSFVAHHMLFSKSIVRDLKKNIEGHTGKAWHEAILGDAGGATFSEYELYGNFALATRRRDSRTGYWFNKGLPRERLAGLETDRAGLARFYNSLSFHHHL
jgi:hypothetical protein